MWRPLLQVMVALSARTLATSPQPAGKLTAPADDATAVVQPAESTITAAAGAADAESCSSEASPLVSEQWSEEHDPRLALGLDRCNVDRVPEAELTLERFEAVYSEKRPVVIVRDPGRNKAAKQMTLKKELLARYGNQEVELTTQFGYAWTNITKKQLRNYLAEDMAKSVSPTDKQMWGQKYNFGPDKYGMNTSYVPPLVAQEKKNQSEEWDYVFQTAIANTGSGLPFHMHGSAFSETLHGIKRWFLCPPALSPRQ
jgi:hypothetical protein